MRSGPLTGTITLDVTPVNDSPVLDPVGDQSVDELATLSFTATASDSDLPADTLSFSLDPASVAAGMSITAGGDFSWTPTETQGGLTPSVTITVTDDGAGTLSTVRLHDYGERPQLRPVLGSIGDQSVDELATLSFTATCIRQ